MGERSTSAASDPLLKRFKARFWLPPRAHGEIIEDRTVSFLELFYDLVYVVVIARAAHHLAEHVTWRGFYEFAVVFGMIWIAWLNGTLLHELHGREDGRSRSYIFLQMVILALLAVFTSGATGEDGAGFAIVYTLFLLVITWQWYAVRRQDTEEYSALTARYLAAMVGSVIVVGVSAPLSEEVRVAVWAAYVVVVTVTMVLLMSPPGPRGVAPTDSLVERFGLFTIIVLGEVVVGVVSGLSEVDRSGAAVATGIIGLMIGFGIWWTYFDFVGRRRPRDHRPVLVQWMVSHLPVSLAIAASGAAMVSLVEHGGDARSPAPTAWLLAGSVAIALVSLTVTMQALDDFERFPSIYRPLRVAMVGAALAALVVGWLRPVPWLFVLLLVLILSAVWWLAVSWWLQLEDPDAALPG